MHALRFQNIHLRFQVVAHEIHLMLIVFVVRVKRHFRRRERKNQPAVARVHRLKTKNVFEESTVCVCIF